LDGIDRVVVPPVYAKRAQASAGRNLTFGIRPAHLEDASLTGSDRDMESTIDATVELVENLGNELQVYLTCGGKDLIATLNTRSRVAPGKQVRLSVDSNQIHLFDSDT